jgi:hypothetical protein
MAGTLHGDQYTVLMASRLTYVSDKPCIENQNSRLMFDRSFFFLENLAFYDVRWKKFVEPGKTRDNMAHAHCMLDT